MTWEHKRDGLRYIHQPRLIAPPNLELPKIESMPSRMLNDFWRNDAFEASVIIREVYGTGFSDGEYALLHSLWENRFDVNLSVPMTRQPLPVLVNPQTLNIWLSRKQFKSTSPNIPVYFPLDTRDFEIDIRRSTDSFFQKLRYMPFEIGRMRANMDYRQTLELLEKRSMVTDVSDDTEVISLRNDTLNYTLLQRYYMVLRKRARTGVMVTDL